jgi:AcrR family transcriptional regulator
MGEQTKIRAPKQARSIDKKEKLIGAAYELFCERGYYKTTTPEVAKRAGLSVGCLYSYFKDKNDLFLAVVERYDARFDELRLGALADLSEPGIPLREALRSLLVELVRIHRESEALNVEMRILAYSDPVLRARQEVQEAKVRASIVEALSRNESRLRKLDFHAAAEIVDALTSGIVHRIAFGRAGPGQARVDEERILEATLDALCAYLLPAITPT